MSTTVWEWGALAINWNVKNYLIVCKQKGLQLFVTRSSNDITCEVLKRSGTRFEGSILFLGEKLGSDKDQNYIPKL